jgi:uncharacterized protein
VPQGGRLVPLGLRDVRIDDGFWAAAQKRNREASIPHVVEWLERTGWLGNFDAAVQGRLPADRTGREFSDSEIYKLLEALAWELGRAHDDRLAATFDTIVARVAAAQEPDGYIGTRFGRPGQQPRWSNLEWGHELYCIGHLIQAAVARARCGHPDDPLVAVASRAADLVCEVFGPGGLESVDGHAEIEPALVELYRVTGKLRYLEQARLQIERRGYHVLDEIEFGRSYFQDDIPVRDAEVFRGHAVRAMYLAAGAADVADETGDDDLLAAVVRQWRATIARRTYITGGMGSRHQDEAFGEDFVLPPDRAYSETCAAIGSVMLSWRLLLATGDARYADLIERTLYNVVATSPADDGKAFFYTNTLHRRELGTLPDSKNPSPRAAASLRAPWFEVSCCPTNVARTMATIAAYVATVDDDGLQLHQYAPGAVAHRLPDGRPVGVTVRTGYPYDGEIRVRIDTDSAEPWALTLRVPGWAADGATLSLDGSELPVSPGTVTEHRRWRAGDEVVLRLPMTPRFVAADDRIDAVRGCVAVEHGPLVYAAESIDLPGVGHVDELRVDTSVPPRAEESMVYVRGRRVLLEDQPWPYGGEGVAGAAAASEDLGEISLLPYHRWANRGPSTMRVWLPRA